MTYRRFLKELLPQTPDTLAARGMRIVPCAKGCNFRYCTGYVVAPKQSYFDVSRRREWNDPRGRTPVLGADGEWTSC